MREVACMEKYAHMKEFTVEAQITNLDAVQDFVASELAALHCSMKLRTQIAIAVEEIFVNIAHYAYNQDKRASGSQKRSAAEAGYVAIRLAVGEEIVIEFEDSGKPYNPLEKDDPDITLSAEKREIGGLGIFMVKNIMDVIKYRYEDNKNILMLKKKVA